jgi:DNA processing protein
VTGAEDILRDFGLSRRKARAAAAQRAPALSTEERTLLRLLKKAESLHVDQIVAKSALSPQRTITLLTTLAVKGAVRELPGKYFAEVPS